MLFPEEIIQQVWEKGIVVFDFNPKIWRKDECGAWISRAEYRNRESPYGWEIDQINPDAQEDSIELSNLRPLQWENKISRLGKPLICPITASGIKNVRSKKVTKR